MGLISVREVINTKGIFFGSQKFVLSSHDSHLAPEMGETHDELLEVDFAIAVIVKDVDDPPEIARYTMSTFLSKLLFLGAGHFGAKQKEYEQIRKNETEIKGPGQNILT